MKMKKCIFTSLLFYVSSAMGGYEKRNIEGWVVKVDKDLLTQEFKENTESNIQLVTEELVEIGKVLPESVLKKLRKVTICITPCNIRTPLNAPQADYTHRDRLVRLGNFHNYHVYSKIWTGIILHELAHAYHYKVLGYRNSKIRKAYRRALKTGHYKGYYPAKNEFEFFAVTTVAYFGKEKDYPANREELERDDPETARLIGKLWKVE